MFIGRRADRSIYGAWTSKQPADANHANIEELSDNDPEVIAFLAPRAPVDLSNIDNLDKALKALGLCIAQVGGLTVPQMKALFKSKWDALP